MVKVFVVVDAQNDFCGETGVLSSPEARKAAANIAEEIRDRADENTVIIFTKDTHGKNYLETQEGQKLPIIHCIKNTYGWELSPVIQEAIYDSIDKYHPFESYFPYITGHELHKNSFGSIDFQNLLFVIEDTVGSIEEITFCGIDTAICVTSNALLAKATLPEVPINVIADCCASVTPESHKNALETMKMCQINII